jgi:hypothetical protein
MPEWSQSFTLTQDVDWSFFLCSTSFVHYTYICRSHSNSMCCGTWVVKYACSLWNMKCKHMRAVTKIQCGHEVVFVLISKPVIITAICLLCLTHAHSLFTNPLRSGIILWYRNIHQNGIFSSHIHIKMHYININWISQCFCYISRQFVNKDSVFLQTLKKE